MPAHAQVQVRTVGLSAPPPTRSNAGMARLARPRSGTVKGERTVLDFIARATADTGYNCTTLNELAASVGLSTEALRLRVDALRADGRLRREPCWCGELDTPHVRFYAPGQGEDAAAHPQVATPVYPPAYAAPAPALPPPAMAAAAAAGLQPGVRWQIQQIVPAQPETWALYRLSGTVWRDPVVAWGVWQSPAGNMAGPLVFSGQALEPAAASPGFVGIRVGAFRCMDGERTFDMGAAATENE